MSKRKNSVKAPEPLEGRAMMSGGSLALVGQLYAAPLHGAGAVLPALVRNPLGAGGASFKVAHVSALAPKSTPTFNTAFLTDAQLREVSWGVPSIRQFLKDKGGYFKSVDPKIKDFDGQVFDLAQTIYDAARQYTISPKVLLATLQKECSGVTRTTRPSFAIMGNGGTTWKGQVFEAARLFDLYQRRLDSTGVTPSGWKVGQAKLTQDGVLVTPATKAVAGQFTYTPYAGSGWGGAMGGVYLFYSAWQSFRF